MLLYFLNKLLTIVGSASNFIKWEEVAKRYNIEDIKQEKLRAKIDSGHYIELDNN